MWHCPEYKNTGTVVLFRLSQGMKREISSETS